MPVQIATNGVMIGNMIVAFTDFSRLVERHLRCYPDTPNLEEAGGRLRASGFAEQQLEAFIRRVCKWGGYAGIAGRIINQNPITEVGQYFRSAMAKLDLNIPDIGGALLEVNHIRGLGTPSFASKHLRFLRPDICPILDSILEEHLNYPFNANGYQALSNDCTNVAILLQSNQVVNPRHRDGNKWFISDVEMALFSYLNNL